MKLTPKLIKQRRAIAEDVIAQLKQEKYVAERGTYVEHESYYWDKGAGSLNSSDVTGELQRFIEQRVTKKNPCKVCALGSAFLSAVRLYDNHAVANGNVTRDMRRKLKEFFTTRELGYVESSFERSSVFIGYGTEDKLSGSRPNWVDVERSKWDAAEEYHQFLGDLTAENRLVFLMKAVATLADRKITLEGLITQALLALANDDSLSSTRNLLGW